MINFPNTISGLSRAETALYRRLLRRLMHKRQRNRTRSAYYDGRNELRDIGYALPPIAKDIEIVVGWPEKAVEELATRVVLDGLTGIAGAQLADTVRDLMDENDLIQTAHSVHADSFVHSCTFVAVLQGDPDAGEPEAIIQEFTADTATGEWDKRGKRLSSALLFDTDDEYEHATIMYLMSYESTIVAIHEGNAWHVIERIDNGSDRIPCELFAFKPDAKRPFGRSRISRTVMSLTDSAVRTFLRSEMQAELYSVPPRYFLGVTEDMFKDDDGNLIPKWKLMLDQALTLPADPATGEKPEVGQFSQYSFQPHVEQLRQTATMFASHTSLPPDAMGVLTDNPSSADAIDKASKDLCLLAENCQRWYAKPWQRIIERAQQVAGPDGQASPVACQWRNPATPSRAAAADAAVKLVSAGILPAESDVTYDMLDLTDSQRQTLRAEQARARAQNAIAQLKAQPSEEAADEPEATTGTPQGTRTALGQGAPELSEQS